MPTPFKVIGRCAKGLIVVPEEKSGPDYCGYMLDGSARAVVMEAKRWNPADGARFQLRVVKPHQQTALWDAVRASTISLLLIVYGPRYTVYAVPWESVPGPQKMPKSLGEDFLAQFE